MAPSAGSRRYGYLQVFIFCTVLLLLIGTPHTSAAPTSSDDEATAKAPTSPNPLSKILAAGHKFKYTCKALKPSKSTSKVNVKRINNASPAQFIEGDAYAATAAGCFTLDFMAADIDQADQMFRNGKYMTPPLGDQSQGVPYKSTNMLKYWGQSSSGHEWAAKFMDPKFQEAYSSLLLPSHGETPGKGDATATKPFPDGPNVLVSLVRPLSSFGWASNAAYRFVINLPHGLITIQEFKTPATIIAENAGTHALGQQEHAHMSEVPELSYLSDVLAVEFWSKTNEAAHLEFWRHFGLKAKDTLALRKKIRHMIIPDIKEPALVVDIVMGCLSIDEIHGSIPEWPGREFNPDTLCFNALLGTADVGMAVGWFFAQHKEKYGIKTFGKVTIFRL